MRSSTWWLGLVVACSSPAHVAPDGSGGGGHDAAADAASAPLALGALMPQEVAGDAHAVMATPTVVAITYDNDPQRADVEAFFTQMAASPAWATETAEYGIGPLGVGTPIHLSGSAAPTDGAIRALLAANLGGASPAWGAPSENTLYSFTLPIDTTFTDDLGQSCCGGYHDDITIGTTDVAYALQCPCTDSWPPPTTALQALTFALSHELVEGVTDPRYEHDYAWGGVDDAHQVWSYVTDGELADMCEFTDTTLWSDAPDMTYTISRIWSNAAASAGTDPCVGAPTAPYYQTVPDQPDSIAISLFGGTVATKGSKIALSTTGTVTLHVAGAAGSGPFQVSAADVGTFFGAPMPYLVFTQPTGTYALGDTIELQVTPKGVDPGLGGSGAEAFELATKPVNGGPTTYFYGLVGQ
jgi:hypothetical protein